MVQKNSNLASIEIEKSIRKRFAKLKTNPRQSYSTVIDDLLKLKASRKEMDKIMDKLASPEAMAVIAGLLEKKEKNK